jgi:hypothetical protein
MGKLNIKLNISTFRHPRTDGLTERVNQIMRTLLRCYCATSGVYGTSHLSMVKFYSTCSINEAIFNIRGYVWVSTINTWRYIIATNGF